MYWQEKFPVKKDKTLVKGNKKLDSFTEIIFLISSTGICLSIPTNIHTVEKYILQIYL